MDSIVKRGSEKFREKKLTELKQDKNYKEKKGGKK